MEIRNAVSGSIASLDNGNVARFNKVKLVGRFCMINDDMGMFTLEKTNFFKQLISAEISLEIEPKESISFQIMTEAMDSFADRLFLPKSRFRKAEKMTSILLKNCFRKNVVF
mgnify:FL=1